MDYKINNNYPFEYTSLEADDTYADFKSVDNFKEKLSSAGYGLEAINDAFAQAGQNEDADIGGVVDNQEFNDVMNYLQGSDKKSPPVDNTGNSTPSTDDTTDKPKDPNVPQISYDSKPQSGTVSTQGADYIVIVKSNGREQKPLDDTYFGTKGGTLVGTVGSKDKGMQLIDVREVDSIHIKDNSEMQIMRINTDGKELKIDNPTNDADEVSGALDPSMKNLSNKYHRDVKQIKRDANSDFAIYADDESDRKKSASHENRVDTLQGGSYRNFMNGDDSSYIFTNTDPLKLDGNGAIMQLSYV